jgi:hypothetical protein
MDKEAKTDDLLTRIERLEAEILILRMAARRANKLVDGVMSVVLDLATRVAYADLKADKLIYKNYPDIAHTFGQLEKILGDAQSPTPGAPRHS